MHLKLCIIFKCKIPHDQVQNRMRFETGKLTFSLLAAQYSRAVLSNLLDTAGHQRNYS